MVDGSSKTASVIRSQPLAPNQTMVTTPRTLCNIILAGLTIPLALATPSRAQDTNATTMKPVVVTGSLIPTAETVGASPVDTLTPEKIQLTGQGDVLASLKALTPSFTGGFNIGQQLNNGGFGEAYAFIRNLPTLVLIDGHRVNITPFSTFVG